MLCRCRCVVKEEEEEDDEKFFEKALPSTKQNKGADTFEKFKIFTDRFWCVMCVLIYDF